MIFGGCATIPKFILENSKEHEQPARPRSPDARCIGKMDSDSRRTAPSTTTGTRWQATLATPATAAVTSRSPPVRLPPHEQQRMPTRRIVSRDPLASCATCIVLWSWYTAKTGMRQLVLRSYTRCTSSQQSQCFSLQQDGLGGSVIPRTKVQAHRFAGHTERQRSPGVPAAGEFKTGDDNMDVETGSELRRTPKRCKHHSQGCSQNRLAVLKGSLGNFANIVLFSVFSDFLLVVSNVVSLNFALSSASLCRVNGYDQFITPLAQHWVKGTQHHPSLRPTASMLQATLISRSSTHDPATMPLSIQPGCLPLCGGEGVRTVGRLQPGQAGERLLKQRPKGRIESIDPHRLRRLQ